MSSELELPDWRDISVSGDPYLIVGRKKGKVFDAARIQLHDDLFDEIRGTSRAAIEKLASTEARRYEPNAEIEQEDEYFFLRTEEIVRARDSLAEPAGGSNRARTKPAFTSETSKAPHDDGLPPTVRDASIEYAAPNAETVLNDEAQEPSSLLAKLGNPGSLEILGRDQLLNYQWLFYAVVWQQGDNSWSAFVRKQNPRVVFKPGRRWCKFGSSLKELSDEPVFILDDNIDLVIHGDNVAGFSSKVIKELFTDVGIFKTQVQEHVQKASRLVSSEIPLTEPSADSLNSLGKRKTSVASRLYGLARRIEELRDNGTLTSERYREVAKGDPRALSLLNDRDEFDFDEDSAEVFLDIIEGRYFEDDWTGSPRRADKFSSRL